MWRSIKKEVWIMKNIYEGISFEHCRSQKLILISHIRWQYIHYYDNNHNKNANNNEQNKMLKGRSLLFFRRCNAKMFNDNNNNTNNGTVWKKKVSHEYFIVSQNKMTFRYKIPATGEILLLLFNIIMPSWNSKILPKVLETLQINK